MKIAAATSVYGMMLDPDVPAELCTDVAAKMLRIDFRAARNKISPCATFTQEGTSRLSGLGLGRTGWAGSGGSLRFIGTLAKRCRNHGQTG